MVKNSRALGGTLFLVALGWIWLSMTRERIHQVNVGFVLVGLLNLMLAVWLPGSLRMVHTLEILADSFVYAWALVMLFRRSHTAASQPAALPAAH